eukprot:m.237345 g.237345  ORF g.237345 m.237345 type:complete len:51 (+) comp21069_c0_seq1:399-551(+)
MARDKDGFLQKLLQPCINGVGRARHFQYGVSSRLNQFFPDALVPGSRQTW